MWLQFHKGALGECGTLHPYNVPFLQQHVLHHLQNNTHPSFHRDVTFYVILSKHSHSCLSLLILYLPSVEDKQQEMVIVLPKLIKPLLPSITFHSSDSSRKRTAGDTHEAEWKTLWARKTHPVWHVDHAFFSNKLQDATVTGAGG